MILWPVRQLGRTLSDIGKAGISIDRLNEIFNEPVEDLTSGERPEITGDIRFSHGKTGILLPPVHQPVHGASGIRTDASSAEER